MKDRTATKRRQARKPRQNVAKIAKNVVKKELAKNLEDKFQINHLGSTTGYITAVPTAAQSNTPFWYPFAGIAQGLGVADRIGLEIIPKSHLISGYVYLDQVPDDVGTSLSYVHTVKIYCGLVRSISSVNALGVGSLPTNSLLRDVDGTTEDFLPYTGTADTPMRSDLLKMNHLLYKPIKTLSITLGKNTGVLNGNNSPLASPYRVAAKFNINLSKHMPKKILYNTNGSVQPENYMPVLYAVVFNSVNGNVVSRPQMALKSVFKYTDA